MDYSTTIRPACLRPADQGWEQPSGPEIREVIRRAGLTDSETARLLGLAVQTQGGPRQVRRWIAEEGNIPYSAWALLCHVAGFGIIWMAKADLWLDRVATLEWELAEALRATSTKLAGFDCW